LKIGQRWPEDEMYKWGSYFGHVPNCTGRIISDYEVAEGKTIFLTKWAEVITIHLK